MNHTEERTAALFDSATTGLTPDVARLVSGGVARGRVLRRRRRIGTALAAAAVLGVIGTAASVAPGLDLRGGGTTATLAPAPATQAAPSETADEPLQPRRIGFDVAKGAAILESLLPEGEVSGREATGSDNVRDLRRDARLLYRGGLVELHLEKPDLADGPMERCEQQPTSTCEALEDGSVFGLVEFQVPEWPDVESLHASLYTFDGFVVRVSAYNIDGTSQDPPVPVAGEPVLTERQLREIVLDPVWLDEQQ